MFSYDEIPWILFLISAQVTTNNQPKRVQLKSLFCYPLNNWKHSQVLARARVCMIPKTKEPLRGIRFRTVPVQQYGEECLRRRHSSPYCCWSLWWISADGTFSPTRNLITMRCSTLRGTFCSLINLATPRQDWTDSNPSRREGGGCGFTLSRSHSCCAVRPVYTQISPRHIWTTLYFDTPVPSRTGLNHYHI